ncbi:hypothetical protein SCHPADRAFT_474183 [Schizopora paradoxa]|uniref:Uncharacterized protein n=1 Tax=Schizopora paradoxa TaxID=27342 RepID=A0A0H2RIC2_9AGAM|nr:hypothetical protein SCHPADRAFT_474183 [Schizopora paradoxa]
MATMTARPTPAGPMSESITPMPADSNGNDDDWEIEYRAELQERQKERLAELTKQAEEDFNKRKASALDDRATLERVHETYMRSLARIKQMMKDEEDALLEREREVRKWSRGEVDDEASEQLKREQQELWDQLRGRRYSNNTATQQRQPSQAPAPQSQPVQRTTMWVPPEAPKEANRIPVPRQTQRSVSGSSTAASFVQPSRTDMRPPMQYGPSSSSSVASGYGPSNQRSPWIPPEGPNSSRTIHTEPDEYYEGESESDDGSDSPEEEYVDEADVEDAPRRHYGPSLPPQKSAPRNIIPSDSRRPSVASFNSASGSPGHGHTFWRPSIDNLRSTYPPPPPPPPPSRPTPSPMHVPDYVDVKQQSPGFSPVSGQRVPTQQRVPSVPPSTLALEREEAAHRESEKPWQSHEQARMRGASMQQPPPSSISSASASVSPPFRQEMRPRPGSTDTDHSSSPLSQSEGGPYRFQNVQSPPPPSTSPMAMPSSARKETIPESAASSMRETAPQFWVPAGGSSSSNKPIGQNIFNTNTHVPPSRSAVPVPPPPPPVNVPYTSSPSVRVRNDSETSSRKATFPPPSNSPLDIPRPRSPTRTAPSESSYVPENVASGWQASSSFGERDRVYLGYASSTTSKRSQSPSRSMKSMFTSVASSPPIRGPSSNPLSRLPTEEVYPESSRSDRFAPRVYEQTSEEAGMSNDSFDSNDSDELEQSFDFRLFDEESAFGGTMSSASSEHNKEIEEQQRKKEEELRLKEEQLAKEKEEFERQKIELSRREEAIKQKEEAERKREEEEKKKKEEERQSLEREKERAEKELRERSEREARERSEREREREQRKNRERELGGRREKEQRGKRGKEQRGRRKREYRGRRKRGSGKQGRGRWRRRHKRGSGRRSCTVNTQKWKLRG